MKSAIFLERDGILNLTPCNGKMPMIPTKVEDFKINPDCIEPLKRLKEAGFLLIVTTNQPGISRGDLTRRELELMHNMLRRRTPIDDIFVCPYEDSEGCPCHKPALGMFREAAHKWRLDLNQSFVVSDKWQDAKAALNMGSFSVMLDSAWIGDVHHDAVCKSIDDIAGKILELHNAPHLMMEAAY
jgi:D-glycero-D-manno-heptose 1,7-bisphosphate phosphatase